MLVFAECLRREMVTVDEKCALLYLWEMVARNQQTEPDNRSSSLPPLLAPIQIELEPSDHDSDEIEDDSDLLEYDSSLFRAIDNTDQGDERPAPGSSSSRKDSSTYFNLLEEDGEPFNLLPLNLLETPRPFLR